MKRRVYFKVFDSMEKYEKWQKESNKKPPHILGIQEFENIDKVCCLNSLLHNVYGEWFLTKEELYKWIMELCKKVLDPNDKDSMVDLQETIAFLSYVGNETNIESESDEILWLLIQ